MAKLCEKCGAAAGKRCKNCKQCLCPWHMRQKTCPKAVDRSMPGHSEELLPVEDER